MSLPGCRGNVEDPKEDGALWALNPFELNLNEHKQPVLFAADGDVARPFFRAAFKRSAPQEPPIAALHGREVDIRMLIQQAAFTIHSSGTPIDELKNANTFLRKYTIPATSKRGIIKELSALGIRRHSLFPDLENLARDLASLRFEDPYLNP